MGKFWKKGGEMQENYPRLPTHIQGARPPYRK